MILSLIMILRCSRSARPTATAATITLQTLQSQTSLSQVTLKKSVRSISAIELRPRTRLQITASGIEVTVRFPVDLQSAADIDDWVMREIYSAIEQEPKLKLVGSGMPTLERTVRLQLLLEQLFCSLAGNYSTARNHENGSWFM